MNPLRFLGPVLLVVGIALLVVGFNASESITDQVSETFTGRFTDTTMWYLIGGLALAILGLLMTFAGFRGRKR